jgi:hypothetical protein
MNVLLQGLLISACMCSIEGKVSGGSCSQTQAFAVAVFSICCDALESKGCWELTFSCFPVWLMCISGAGSGTHGLFVLVIHVL